MSLNVTTCGLDPILIDLLKICGVGAPVQDIIADDTQVYVCINVCSQSDAIQKLQACF